MAKQENFSQRCKPGISSENNAVDIIDGRKNCQFLSHIPEN